MKAAGYDKTMASMVEGRVSSHRVEGVMNILQVYHPSPRDDGVDRDACIPELVLKDCQRGEIGTMDKKRGPNKLRAAYAPTKDDVKDYINNDDDANEAKDDADPYSKAPRRTAWDMMWENRGPRVWVPDYREQ